MIRALLALALLAADPEAARPKGSVCCK